MKTDLLVLAGTALLLVAVPMVSPAEEDDARSDAWATRSPLAFGEPMGDCDIRHDAAVIAAEPALPVEKADPLLAAPDAAPAVLPAVVPAVVPLPAKALPEKTTRASPRHLSPATLLTFALIASPGTALPQTTASRD